jgi:predicted site-specific integrase-resolvase
MAKWAEREQAIRLLRRHPGWSDRRVAEIVRVSHTTVSRWRAEAALAPALKQVGKSRRRAELVATPLGRVIVARARRRVRATQEARI